MVKENCQNQVMIRELVDGGWLKSRRIIRAFERLPREFFVRPADRDFCYDYSSALEIPGQNATCSAPNVNALILELLNLRIGERVLDIGLGSGWLAGLMAKVVGAKGKIYGMETDSRTLKFGLKNLRRAGIKNPSVKLGNGLAGWRENSPFDAIAITFAIDFMPPELFRQLNKKTGRILAPVKTTSAIDCDLVLYWSPDFRRPKVSLPGFRFVPARV